MTTERLPETPATAAPNASRWGLVLAWGVVVLGVATLLRVALFVRTPDAPSTVPVFAIGLVFDLVVALCAALPLVAYVSFVPDLVWRNAAHRWLVLGVWCAAVYGVLLESLVEWFFWEEFGARFNFIAVDYLIYTKEVVGNVEESYPLGLVLPLLAIPTAAIVWGTRRLVLNALASRSTLRERLPRAAMLAGAAAVSVTLVSAALAESAGDRIAAELAGNGPYSFVAAFRNNTLDYRDYYATRPDDEVLRDIRHEIGMPPTASDADGLTRTVPGAAEPRRHNVVMVVVESLSAKFMERFGHEKGQRGVTPRLDALANESLLFTRLYSTGIRTVRGLEALSLSIPPTPGRSIVKRPDNGGLTTIGSVLRSHGYATRFIYGGYGYFDNMNAYFSGNGFDVVDRTDISDEATAFGNIWGIADESLLDRALIECDVSHAAGQPFMSMIMTTSNHRPFTYPEGRIDIPSGDGRDGAIKYTDYAIGRFLDMAATKPWFGDTIFVIVADHCSSSRGYVDLPVDRFHIPMLIYAPGIVEPGTFDGVCSQIDVAPTVLGLLGLPYASRFFGVDVLEAPPGRALLCNYLHLGLYDGEALVTLGPRKTVVFEEQDARGRMRRAADDPAAEARAIAYFQGAVIALERGLLRETPRPKR